MSKKVRKKRKKPNKFVDYMVYLALRLVSVFIQIPDTATSVRMARALGSGLWAIYKRGRIRAIDNLRQSFPDKDDSWYEATAKRSLEQIAMLAFDSLRCTRLITRSTWKQHIVLEDNLAAALKIIMGGRGVIMVTGHYGNFEVLGYVLATLGLESYSVARPIDNPYINQYLLGVRENQGQIIVDKKGATEQILNILEQGSTLSFVADQNAGKKGIFVDFFGRKASTYKSIGLLAMQYDLPIVVGYCRRIGDEYKFSVGVEEVIYPDQWKQQDRPLDWITQQYTAAIESFIRKDPSQYWWIHRRWKTRPPAERRAAKAKEKQSI
ncbi:MAG: lysophospholipid acyltransferase family protein [Phycisphaerae bacterium]|nr:lysophospholipid acyltransferase family protein [Phycisphaerae bacterium]